MTMVKELTIIFCLAAVTASCIAQNVSYDKKLGAENAILVEQEMGIYKHDSLSQLINAVGKKLVSRLKNNPFEFKFFLADSPEPNAFALPGGFVYVTRGILPLIQTEDELAGIMAHEIIHVTERHSVKQMKKGLIGGVLQIPGNLINTVTHTRIGNILNTPIAFTSQAFVARYSRNHERDADSYGIQLAASAGYDPNALATALARLSKGVELLTGKAEKKNYFSDHPFTPARVTDIRKAAPKYKPVGSTRIASSQETFRQTFDGLCFGPNPKQGIFTDSLFIHPDLGFSWIAPSGWNSVNKPASVGSYSEKGDAFVVLSIADTAKSVKEIGEYAKGKAEKSKDVIVLSAIDTTINHNTAYLLRLKRADKKGEVFLELLWVEFEGNVFSLAGAYAPPHKTVAHNSLCSFRKSHDEELANVVQYDLRVVQAEKNETLGQLSKRSDNRLNLGLMAVINDLDQKNPISENILVKIVRSRAYKP
ncbi:MAG TPA: M48 family metalloprotease [Chryseolinea sp.]